MRRRAKNANPPSWLTSVYSGNSVTTRPNAHDHSDAYPLRASGPYPLSVEAAVSAATANAPACRVMLTIRAFRIRPPYEAKKEVTSARCAVALLAEFAERVTGEVRDCETAPGQVPVSARQPKSSMRGKQPECVSGVPSVGDLGERLGHLPQLLGHLTPLRRIQGGQFVEHSQTRDS